MYQGQGSEGFNPITNPQTNPPGVQSVLWASAGWLSVVPVIFYFDLVFLFIFVVPVL